MEKAYDLKDLGSRLKAKGLIQAEEAVEDIYVEVSEWLKESAVISSTPFDNIIPLVLGYVDPMLVKIMNKIDGEEG